MRPRESKPGFRLPVYLSRFALLALLLPGTGVPSQLPEHYERPTNKPMDLVLEDLEFAITERNFRVTGRLQVGAGIRETTGSAFPDYEVIMFCNLTFARRMIELNPSFINFCPGRITVREHGSKVIIAAPLLPRDTGNRQLDELTSGINELIMEIVDYAQEPWPEVTR